MSLFGRASRGVVALSLLTAVPLRADPIEDFYKGKQIEIVAAGEAATTQDIWARLLARFMPKYLPGHPVMLVKNIPGGGHIKAANYLYAIAPKDGTTIGTFSATIITSYLLKMPGFNFDTTTFGWLGSPDRTNRVCVAKRGAEVQSAAELFSKDLIVGGTGASGGVSGPPTLLKNVLGMRFKLVEGYPGPPDIFVAMDRGELDGLCSLLSGMESMRPGGIADGSLKVLFNMEHERVPGLDAPTIYEFAKTDEQRQIINFYDAGIELGRPFLTPPGIPPQRLAALRKAFLAALADSDFATEAKKARLDITAVSGEQLDKVIADLRATPPDIVARTSALVGTGN